MLRAVYNILHQDLLILTFWILLTLNRLIMLVSGHTIQLFVNWDDVPERFHDLVKDKSETDIIIYCPTTMKTNETFLNFIRSIKPVFFFKLSDGILFYKKGIPSCNPVVP
jgi:translation elongation factor EF-1alpha